MTSTEKSPDGKNGSRNKKADVGFTNEMLRDELKKKDSIKKDGKPGSPTKNLRYEPF